MNKYSCKVIECTKLFKGVEFWRKHVKKRHLEFYYALVQQHGTLADSSAANRVWHNEICIDLIAKYTVRSGSIIDLHKQSWCYLPRSYFEGALLDPLRVTRAGFSLGLKHRWSENTFWDADGHGDDTSFFGLTAAEAGRVRRVRLSASCKASDDPNNLIKFDWAGLNAFFAVYTKLEYFVVELITYDGDQYQLLLNAPGHNSAYEARAFHQERFAAALVAVIRSYAQAHGTRYAAIRTENVKEDCDFDDDRADLRELSDDLAGERIAHRDLVEFRI